MQESNKMIEINNFTLNYRHNKYYQGSLRDSFIAFITNPFRFFLKRSKEITILDSIDLTINAGDRIAFIGENGVGKTSLCRAISGMRGKCPEIKRFGKVRSIFSSSVAIEKELTGRENALLLIHLVYPNLSKKEKLEVLQDSIDFAELGDYNDVAFKYYSTGMKVRVFLSVISALPADILILDEVFNGADEFFNEKITKRVTKMIDSSKVVIFISHSSAIVEKVCNRAVVLHNKKIKFDGKPNDAFRHYRRLMSDSAIESKNK